MLTRCSFPLNTAFQQNKRMIYSFSYRRSLFPNQIFRRLILINGAFNVIAPLNIHRNVAAPLNHQSVRHLFPPFFRSWPLCFPSARFLISSFSRCYASPCEPAHRRMSKRLPKRKEISFFRQKAGEILRSVCYQTLRSIWAKQGNDSTPVKPYQNVFRGCETRNQVKAL